LAKYLSRSGHEIVVVSTKKSNRDGPLTELVPSHVRLYELDAFGRLVSSDRELAGTRSKECAERRIHWLRRLKQRLVPMFGQLLDNRIWFPFVLWSPALDQRVRSELSSADIFVSSFPPWPVHLAGMLAQRRFEKPWVADYRDQFSYNHVTSGGWPSNRIELWIDRILLKRAAAVTAISGPMQMYYQQMHQHVVCIENGYDKEIFDIARAKLLDRPRQERATPVVRYLGTVMRDAIPVNFVAALARLDGQTRQGEKYLKVELYGDTRHLEDYVRLNYPNLLNGWLEFLPPVPYSDALEKMLTADALLFAATSDLSSLSARGVLTTKLFEYLASGRQIIAEVDDATLAASYIRQASPAHVVSRDVDTLSDALMKLGSATVEIEDNAFVESLSRERKAQQFERLALKVVRGEVEAS
jgi:glycosyltransferase involved in cell wall biosynthesis